MQVDQLGPSAILYRNNKFTFCDYAGRMERLTNIADLDKRITATKHALSWLVAVLLVAMLAGAFLLESGSGERMVDIHFPDRTLHLLARVPAGELHVVGGVIGRVQRALSVLLTFCSAGAVATIIWALVKRRRRAALLALAWLVSLSFVRPVSPPTQPNPPVAVSPSVARSALALEPTLNAPPDLVTREEAGTRSAGIDKLEPARADRDPVDRSNWQRYILAQILYAEGNRVAARRLATGVRAIDLDSPIEAPFRLQYLNGEYRGRTTVCYVSGCLSERVRRLLLFAAFTAAVAASMVALATGWLLVIFNRRASRIARLQEGRSRRRHGFT